MLKRKNAELITFSGQLHGIGFRRTVFGLAEDYPELRGYVKNIPNNAVELLLIGATNEIEMLLDDIINHERLKYYIKSVEHSRIITVENYDKFSIKIGE